MTPSTPSHVTLPEAELESFDTLNFGTVSVPARPSRFGFQVDVTPTPGMNEVVFGLVQSPAGSRSGKPRLGFAVRVDLERGEIWDLVNGSGLIGWVETPLGCAGSDRTFLLSLEIERIGSALLPKLQVGGEEWLYPAVRSTDALDFVAIAGCAGSTRDSAAHHSHLVKPSVWCEAA